MKQIKLTQGQYALVDDADYDWLNQWKWHAHKHHSGNFYAARMSPRKKDNGHNVSMAREILGLKQRDSRQADHINHNTLDNRRDNLRICTHQQNLRNQKSPSNTSSQYKGVRWHKTSKKWQAQIKINGKSKYLGSSDSEKEAALMYNKAAKKYFGEFAYLNVII